MPTTASNGQIVMGTGDVPTPKPLELPKITGSIAQVAAAKTASDSAQAAAAYKELGAGQKGSARTRKGRGRRLRGGATPTVQPSNLPSANSIPGVSATGISKGLTDLQAQIKASGSYDKLANAQPMKMGGRRGGFLLRGAEELYPGSGTQEDTKRKRKTKKKHGRRHNRTHRRKHSRRHTVRRRGGRYV
jgi:hypothetical protein